MGGGLGVDGGVGGGWPWRLLMGAARLQQPLPMTPVVVTQASLPPALSGGDGSKEGGFCFLWPGAGLG